MNENKPDSAGTAEKHYGKKLNFNRSEQDGIVFHLAFVIITLLTLLSSPDESMGFRIWYLIIGWYAGIMWVAIRRLHSDWLLILKFLVPLCCFFVFPDGFLATVLHTLEFTDMGVGMIYNVTSFMPLMWSIPLFMSTMIGRGMEARGASTCHAALSAGMVASIIFTASEEILTQIPIWVATENCRKVGNVAIYVVLPEFILGMLTFLAIKNCTHRPFWLQIFVAFTVMSAYLGNLAVFHLTINHGHQH